MGGMPPPNKEKNETANPGHLNFFLTPHWPKFQQTFLSTKFSQKVSLGAFLVPEIGFEWGVTVYQSMAHKYRITANP